MAGERTLVFGPESKLNDCNVSAKDYVFHEVTISREGSDEGPDELLENGRFPLHEAARNLNRHVVRVVGHDSVLIHSTPRGIVFDHERFDINDGPERSNDRHGCLLGSLEPPGRCQTSARGFQVEFGWFTFTCVRTCSP